LFENANLNQYKTQGAQPGLSVAKLNEVKFKIPSLSEQQRIVSILDTFEASIQNLEAQLSQREKQYEYYRNKLLTFE
jgi:restriction endonuclease S subunit